MRPVHRNNKQVVYHLYKVLTVVRALPRDRVTTLRPYPMGPAALTRLSIGALVAQTALHAIAFPEHLDFFKDEFARRDMPETASIIDGYAPDSQELEGDLTKDLDDRLSLAQRVGVTDRMLESVAQAIDLSHPEKDPYRDNTMMSPYETVQDMVAVDTSVETVDAFLGSVGASSQSPSIEMSYNLYTPSPEQEVEQVQGYQQQEDLER